MSVPALDSLGCQIVDCGNFGGNRPFTAMAPWGVQAAYFNGNTPALNPQSDVDPFVTPELLREAEEQHGLYGAVYFVMPRGSSSSSDGAAWAEAVSKRLEELGGMTRVQAALVDVEKVPLAFQTGFAPRWDLRRPFRPTIYSVEPFQDSSQNDYAAMLARNAAAAGVRKVTFQCYFGGMQPQPPLGVRLYLTQRGLSPDDLCPTIDPKQPAAYIGSALTCGTRGAVLFQAGRMLG